MQGLTDDARAARSAAAEARRQKLLARGQNRLASITIGNILDNAATGTTAAIPGTATTQHSKQQANQAGHSKVVKPTGRISSQQLSSENRHAAAPQSAPHEQPEECTAAIFPSLPATDLASQGTGNASGPIGVDRDSPSTGTAATPTASATKPEDKQYIHGPAELLNTGATPSASIATTGDAQQPSKADAGTPATAERALNWSRYGDAHPSASQASTKAKQGGLERPMRITKLQVLSIALETSQRVSVLAALLLAAAMFFQEGADLTGWQLPQRLTTALGQLASAWLRALPHVPPLGLLLLSQLAILVATIGMLLVRPGGLQKKAINAKYIANARADMHMQLLRLLPGASEAAMSASSLLRALGTMANAVAVFLCAYALLIAIWDGEFQPWVESISSWGHQLMGCPHHALASKDL